MAEISDVLAFLPLNDIITPVREVERQLDRILTLLRNKIRQRGFTQLEVQEVLGWGRSYISQLLTKQKSLRVEQVLLILNVIGVDPADFFAELYYAPRMRGVFRAGDRRPGPVRGAHGEEELAGFEEMRSWVRGLVWLLVDKEVIDVDELTDAVKTRKDGPLAGEPDPDEGPAN